MDDAQVLAALERDDAYRVVRVLADRPQGRTELVRGAGPELLVRKRVPAGLANEAAWQALRQLHSPLLPEVRDLYWLPDQLVVVTAYVEGVTLSELVESTGPLPAADAVRLVGELCEAVGVLHAHGVVHRDVAPGNAVVQAGHARIIDLGNARAYVEGAEHDTTRLGTWGFAAPEQYGFAQSDARSDVHGLGSLLGYLLTGVTPGSEEFDAVLADETRVPADLRLVVRKARAFEPSARYQTASALAAAALAALPGRVEVRAIPVPVLEPVSAAGTVPAAGQAARDVRSALPASPERHGLRGTSLWCKVRIALLWGVWLFFSSAFVAAGTDQTAYKRPGDFVYYPVACIISVGCLTAWVVGRSRAMVARDKGLPTGEGPLGWAVSFAKWAAICLVATLFVALLSLIFFH